MAANLADHQEIRAIETTSGNTPNTESVNEKALQTFLRGVPVQYNAGRVQEWDGATVTNGIAGVTLEFGKNLATDGKGAPVAFGQVGSPGTGTTFGSVPYEASAVNIPRGAPISDGRTLHELAVLDTLFEGQVDNSAFAVAGDATPVQGDIGKQFGLTKDATGHWYVDRNKTTVGVNTVVVINSLSNIDGSILNARVWFYFLKNASQVQQ